MSTTPVTLQLLVTEIEALGQRAIAVQADAGNPSDIKKLIEQAVVAFERVDILVCNAGLLMMKDLASTTPEDFDKIFGVNVKGPYFLAQVSLSLREGEPFRSL